VDAVTLRQAFAVFLGEMRFRAFVRQLADPEMYLGRPGSDWPPESIKPGHPRGLRYWQQQEWDRFTAIHPEFATSAEELALVLRICEVHGQERQRDTAEVFHGCVDYADEYIVIRNRLFPHASRDLISTEGAPFQENQVVVWYCSACRKAKAEWEQSRQRKRRN
jgi:hypothetical protein